HAHALDPGSDAPLSQRTRIFASLCEPPVCEDGARLERKRRHLRTLSQSGRKSKNISTHSVKGARFRRSLDLGLPRPETLVSLAGIGREVGLEFACDAVE